MRKEKVKEVEEVSTNFLIPVSGRTYCPVCHLGIGVGQGDIISALDKSASSINDIKFYCVCHVKILSNINLTIPSIKQLRYNYFQRPPTITEVFHFSYALNMLSRSEDSKVSSEINRLAKRFGIAISTSRCINWANSIEQQPEYSPKLHFFNPIFPIYKTKNNLIFVP